MRTVGAGEHPPMYAVIAWFVIHRPSCRADCESERTVNPLADDGEDDPGDCEGREIPAGALYGCERWSVARRVAWEGRCVQLTRGYVLGGSTPCELVALGKRTYPVGARNSSPYATC
jgi:hypothetical protein